MGNTSAFPQAARRAERCGEGWIPLAGRVGKDGDAFSTVLKYRAMLKESGRSEDSCPVTLSGCNEDADLLKRYLDLGVLRPCVSLPAAKADQVLPTLDRWAALIRQANV